MHVAYNYIIDCGYGQRWNTFVGIDQTALVDCMAISFRWPEKFDQMQPTIRANSHAKQPNKQTFQTSWCLWMGITKMFPADSVHQIYRYFLLLNSPNSIDTWAGQNLHKRQTGNEQAFNFCMFPTSIFSSAHFSARKIIHIRRIRTSHMRRLQVERLVFQQTVRRLAFIASSATGDCLQLLPYQNCQTNL